MPRAPEHAQGHIQHSFVSLLDSVCPTVSLLTWAMLWINSSVLGQ